MEIKPKDYFFLDFESNPYKKGDIIKGSNCSLVVLKSYKSNWIKRFLLIFNIRFKINCVKVKYYGNKN